MKSLLGRANIQIIREIAIPPAVAFSTIWLGRSVMSMLGHSLPFNPMTVAIFGLAGGIVTRIAFLVLNKVQRMTSGNKEERLGRALNACLVTVLLGGVGGGILAFKVGLISEYIIGFGIGLNAEFWVYAHPG